ncbi:uncharacterized protein LOC127799263 [Diospyros lotus]|uniref:uncharacterized protein LOC127799263 n=1 Tax=Diospyros lotus TaxID=55363 RepID=UPI002250CE6F|nr:uncharacterized protein LOC127799263 [Diospyros lotus]
MRKLLVPGLVICSVYLIVINHFINCPGSPLSAPASPPAGESPTNLSHLLFGVVSSAESWRARCPLVEAWWLPNVTRGFVFLDTPPAGRLLPWRPTSPPFRVSDNTSRLEQETNHAAPIMVRMVHAIQEAYREAGNGVRWFVMGFDDSVFFVENWVDVLGKYDHRKYYYIGGYSETVMSNYLFSFEQAFGGGGFALSYPLAAAMAKDLDGCIRRSSQVPSHDTIVQYCVNELGVSLTVEKGIHQIDLRGDISGLLSAHPQSPLLSLHHLPHVRPIFPSMDRFTSVSHLINAATNSDQSRLLQQTICYHRPKHWSFSVSWGYAVHIYEHLHPRFVLKRPLETFEPWKDLAKNPKFMFNTRSPCETPSVFFLESMENATSPDRIVGSYVRSPPPPRPQCHLKGDGSSLRIAKVRVFSSATKLAGVERSECCDIVHEDGSTVAEVKLRACRDDEIIG